jgi:phosphoribosylaminoimidazolecarboxamide formyltransferase/IMP cyclohydrolase
VPDTTKTIHTALISVYHKKGLENIVSKLKEMGTTIFSTGGTFDYLEEKGIPAVKIEDLTSYPGILGGRVKTLHPKVFGGILGRRDLEGDILEMEKFEIPAIDLVIVDLYPFEETLKSGAIHSDIIEKIDIGGISLIRAAAKNYEHVVTIPSQEYYEILENILLDQEGTSTYEQRKGMAAAAFSISSRYDGLISQYLSGSSSHPEVNGLALRYGENPHQKAWFDGNLDEVFTKIQGKELSYNNLVDINAGLHLIREFDDPAVAVIKHTNPCGLAVSSNTKDAWLKALAADPVSAFGGIIVANREIDEETAGELDKLFFEICAAPSYTNRAVEILCRKKNRIILQIKSWQAPALESKTILNGMLIQEQDFHIESRADLKPVTENQPTQQQIDDLLFANKLVKHAKSNTIVLAHNKQLIGIGIGQTSRIDALEQAIAKAKKFGFSLEGTVMASDAFFPFPDCVQIAHEAGIKAVIQPGGSVRDQDSIDFCNKNGLAMVITGYRHFKH